MNPKTDEKIPRAKINYLGAGIQVVIPSRKNIAAILILSVWLSMWFTGETSSMGELFRQISKKGSIFLTFWISVWTFAGVVVFYHFFWMLAGREIITLTQGVLRIERKIFGVGSTKEYPLFAIKNFRVVSIEKLDLKRDPKSLPKRGGKIAFDFESKTIGFASALSEAEAKEIFELFRKNYYFQ
jgi:hypothetical protein